MSKRFWRNALLTSILLLVIAIWSVDYWVSRSTSRQIFSDIQAIPKHKVGLLLGTSKYLNGGGINPYYQYRIDAAVLLYNAGKISFILVSGDNRTVNYNEPERMKRDLVARGIPEERIFLDHAGFRTLDSILRCKDVFGENNFTIISQPFHNERALFIANRRGISAIAFNARDVEGQDGVKVMLREKLARIKMVFDLLLNTQPKYFGPRIIIN
ncbi:MAG: protein SanA [Bacteroidetes bacterium 46-16]|nr:MAG: protein SanA [Bacteroidetes bacterium 46-16]